MIFKINYKTIFTFLTLITHNHNNIVYDLLNFHIIYNYFIIHKHILCIVKHECIVLMISNKL